MRKFRDYKSRVILLTPGNEEHIRSVHPEIGIDQITVTLADPDEVRRSSKSEQSSLYYRKKSRARFVCVVVKECPDGNFVSTAMTTSKPKFGGVIYVKSK